MADRHQVAGIKVSGELPTAFPSLRPFKPPREHRRTASELKKTDTNRTGKFFEKMSAIPSALEVVETFDTVKFRRSGGWSRN